MRSDNEEYSNDFQSDSGSDIIIPRKRLRVISDSSDDDEVTASTPDDDVIHDFLPLDTIFLNASNAFSEVPGPKRASPPEAKPIEYFNNFFNVALHYNGDRNGSLCRAVFEFRKNIETTFTREILGTSYHCRNESICCGSVRNGHYKTTINKLLLE